MIFRGTEYSKDLEHCPVLDLVSGYVGGLDNNIKTHLPYCT